MSCLLGMEAVQLLMRGTPLKRIALAAMALLALVTIALLYLRGQPDVLENAPSTGKQVATVYASEASDRVTSAGHDATPATTWASASSAEIDRDFHDTRNRAESGDPVAQRKLAQMYERCMLYSQSPENFRAMLEMYAQHTKEDAARFSAVAQRLSHYCDSIDSGKRIPMVAYQLWYAEAARRGDLIAQIKVATTIENQPTEAAYRELVAKAFQSRDPEAIFALGDMLSLAKASVDLGAYASQPGGNYSEYAWELAACRAGAECSPGSFRMDSACMAGMCNGSSFESQIKHNFIPPAQLKFLERDVERIRSLLEANN
ncbi:hypothetical protein VDG04_02965 [Xanthomonas campestris pv. raphani]|uniref:hypothetical protein n=1 Tax=Xanthomonas TaxID=338 RepID=UPI002554F3BA|nr:MULTISPECIES: hypothetical protein [Xanthomonas]MEA9895571.1 hypothetical protein [Xanthomonas campestris pv. raphani]MEB2230537.1 hypothetical protein [Xanthomonas campestris pv. campestris]